MHDTTVQVILSLIIFIAAYALIIIDRLDRAVVAMSGGVLMILLKILSQEKAFEGIDFNTIGLLISMMVIVMILKRSGVFEYLAIRIVKAAKGEPVAILVLLSIATGIMSAFLDNVTTVMLIIPVTLSIAKDLHVNPVPFIISGVFASNVGGTATLIGDPPNIMIGSDVGFSFMDFIKNNSVIVLPLLFLTVYIFVLIYKKKLRTTEEAKRLVMAMDERSFIKDRRLLVKGLAVLGLTIVGFLLHGTLGYESATVSIAGASALLLISGLRPEKVLHEIEWKTIFFFTGLFIMVGGLKETRVIDAIAKGVVELTRGDIVLMSLAILWVSAIASAFIDNIPFVATMIPVLKDVALISGIDLTPAWWSLSLGACLGGNGTIIGASANVIAVGLAEEHGHKITFGRFFRLAFPIMLLTIAICSVYIYFAFLV